MGDPTLPGVEVDRPSPQQVEHKAGLMVSIWISSERVINAPNYLQSYVLFVIRPPGGTILDDMHPRMGGDIQRWGLADIRNFEGDISVSATLIENEVSAGDYLDFKPRSLSGDHGSLREFGGALGSIGGVTRDPNRRGQLITKDFGVVDGNNYRNNGGNSDEDRRNRNRTFRSIFVFMCGGSLLGLSVLSGIRLLTKANKAPLRIAVVLFGLCVGIALTAHGTSLIINILAPIDRRSENIRVVAVIISKLELGNIERQVLAADLVEGANNATLEDRLALNGADNRRLCGWRVLAASPNAPTDSYGLTGPAKNFQ